MTEDVVILGCLDNDPVSQRELYNKYSSKMLSVCYRYASNKSDAEDMLQEAFIRIFSNIHSYMNKGAFEGWLRRVVVNTCINYLKKNKKFSEEIDLEHGANIEVKENIHSFMLAKQVIECIKLLPVGFRTVLNLYAIEGYSHKEISNILDIEESTSRSQYTRAKVLLEQILIKRRIIEKESLRKEILSAI